MPLHDISVDDMSVFLGWATDDPITRNWIPTQWKTNSSKKNMTVFNEIPTGGHVVSVEYAEPILQFLHK
jgi:predicted alpha/beta-fold hydrolase